MAWAPKGSPLVVDFRKNGMPYIACFAAISVNEGCKHVIFKEGAAFKGEDICEFVQSLKWKVRRHDKIAVFWDNASIHHKPRKETCYDLGIPVIRNAPYRPDLNGIEFFWGHLKRLYRREVTKHRVQAEEWNQLKLVQRLVHNMPTQVAKDCAE